MREAIRNKVLSINDVTFKGSWGVGQKVMGRGGSKQKSDGGGSRGVRKKIMVGGW